MSEATSRRKNRWVPLISVAALLGLGVYACYPGPAFKEWPGSPPAPSPDGARSAQMIFRQERPPSFSLSWEGGDGFRSRLRVTDASGAVRESPVTLRTYIGWWTQPEAPIRLTWEDPVRLRIEIPGRPPARGYDLGTCVRLVLEDGAETVKDPGQPLPGALVSRLLAMGRPEAEVRGLKMLRWEASETGSRPDVLVSERSDVLLVLGRTGRTEVVSRGPVLLQGEACPETVGSASWVFFTDRSGVGTRVDGTDLYAATGVSLRPEQAGRPPVPVK